MAIRNLFTLDARAKITQIKEWSLSSLEDPEITRERELCESSLAYFLKKAWHAVEGGVEYVHDFHIDAICAHLEACYTGDIKYLIINVPPRTSKSTICSIMFPAWVWAKDPSKRFLFSSYAQKLSSKHSMDCRNLIMSPWYQKLWGQKFQIAKDDNSKLSFSNNHKGFRMASSVGGTNTGYGGDFAICDDGNNATDGESEAIRNSTNDWWSGTMSTRGNNFSTFCRIVIQQRLHENDLTGYITSGDQDVVLLRLPMEYEYNNPCTTVVLPQTGILWRDPRTKEGEILCPNRVKPEDLIRLKAELRTEYRRAGQLQQRPAPAEGGMFKKQWFVPFEEPELPKLEMVIQSWDTAMSLEDGACASACVTIGIFRDKHRNTNMILLNSWSGRIDFAELRLRAQRYSMNCYDTNMNEKPWSGIKADVVLVEAKANGISLIQELTRAGIPVLRFDPGKYGDKMQRAGIASGYIECGRFFVPSVPPNYERLYGYADKLVNACATFPNNLSNDIVDALSQGMIYITRRGWVEHSRNFVKEEIPYNVDDSPLY